MVASAELPLEPVKLSGAYCAFGVFDGVHRGHRFLIESMKQAASSAKSPTAIITFACDPDELFGGDGFKKIMTNEARLELLSSLGVDAVAVLPFDEQVARLSPDEFLKRLFADAAPRQIHVGEGFRFGADARGTVEDLANWGRAHEMDVIAHPLLAWDGERVSSSAIRMHLLTGQVDRAAGLLGRPYRLCGEVLHGRAEGRDLGIRTANLQMPSQLLAIGEGVYGCYAWVGEERYRAAVSVGVAPTFAQATANVEAHLIDFDGDLYGDGICLDFMAWLRPMRQFQSVEELVEVIGGNIRWVRENL